MAECILYDRECIECGECEVCPFHDKKCDNCFECLKTDVDYAGIVIDSIEIPEQNNHDKKLK